MAKESYDERREIHCGVCRKGRILSLREAVEDGWRYSFEEGIVCPKCVSNATSSRPLNYLGREDPPQDIGLDHMQLEHFMNHLHIV